MVQNILVRFCSEVLFSGHATRMRCPLLKRNAMLVSVRKQLCVLTYASHAIFKLIISATRVTELIVR